MAGPTKAIDIAFRDLTAFDADKLNLTRESPATCVVSSDAPVLDTARRADIEKPALILVVDSHQSISGIIHPDSVRDTVYLYLGVRKETFFETIKELVDRNRNYPAAQRVTLYWCDPGQHYTGTRPCSYH
jgi:hypothetical protein